MHFFVDESDLKNISMHSWRIYPTNRNYFRVETSVSIGNNRNSHFTLCRFLLNPTGGYYVDHKDCDPLNNRRDNLRLSLPIENSHNAPKTRFKTSSIYKGVCWHKRKKLWMTLISCNRKSHFVGYFHSEIDAALAYNQKAKELHGDFAYLNKINN